MIKKISIGLVLIALSSSCVSKKVFNELETKFADLKKENRKTQDLYDSISKAKSQLDIDYSSLKKDYEKTKAERDKLAIDFAAADKNLKTLQASYTALEKNSDESLKENMAKNRELLAQLEAKEKALAAKESAREASAVAGYDPFKSSIESQLRGGLINFQQAQDYLREYTTKYDMFGKEGDVNQFAKLYSEDIAPKRFQTGLGAAYEEILGRKATEEEKTAGLERFKGGYYQTVNDLKESLYKGQEYQKKFNRSYLDSYYDTMYGDEIKDAEGVGTGKRNFKFDKSLLPTYGGDLAARTKVTLPSFADQFEGTPAELEQQLQNVRDSRQFLYSAGLTNLQGEIDKETQKLKNEGAKEVQKIAAQGDIYKSLVSSFSF
jgi:hypothetical protein